MRDRVRVGEQLRAIYQGRDRSWSAAGVPARSAARVLADVRSGRVTRPSPIAGHYRELCETEASIRRQLTDLVEAHPAWPWLSSVRGVGALLAAELLARLDRERAPRPSSFWAYCGLHTVPAYLARCVQCGAVFEVASDRSPPRQHLHATRRGERCDGHVVRLERATLQERGARRVASARAGSRIRRQYDHAARVTCHLIGVSMLRTHGTYEPWYRQARARYELERPEWRTVRIHLAALRVMEKRFLLDLWHAWPRLRLPERNSRRGRSRRGSETGTSEAHPIE